MAKLPNREIRLTKMTSRQNDWNMSDTKPRKHTASRKPKTGGCPQVDSHKYNKDGSKRQKMSGTSWVGKGGKSSNRSPPKSVAKKSRESFNLAWNKKKSKYY